jgi:hypothetical protein
MEIKDMLDKVSPIDIKRLNKFLDIYSTGLLITTNVNFVEKIYCDDNNYYLRITDVGFIELDKKIFDEKMEEIEDISK